MKARKSDVVIRPFQSGDLEQTAMIMVSSFERKFRRDDRLTIRQLAEMSIHLTLVHPLPFKGYMVATVNDEVAGVIALKWKGQERAEAKVAWGKAFKFGTWRALKTLFSLAILDSKPEKGECYLEHIAVSGDHRGLGIGTRLIDAGERMALEEGLSTYSLYVSQQNEGAIRLYERRGFVIEQELKSWLTKRFFGIPEWYKMVKKL